MNNFDAWDRTLFLKINAGPAAPEALLSTAMFIATDAIYVIPLMLVAMWVWGDEKNPFLDLHDRFSRSHVSFQGLSRRSSSTGDDLVWQPRARLESGWNSREKLFQETSQRRERRTA